MFAPTLLGLLRLLSARPGGVRRGELHRLLEMMPPEWVDRALEKLLELGLAEQQRAGLVVPLPGLKPLALQMERLARHINREQARRDAAMDMVKMLFRGP